MSLGLDEVVVVDIAVAPTPLGLASFGKLLFLSDEVNEFTTTERIREYTSMKAVEEDFKTGEVLKAAQAYYGQTPKPRFFMVGNMSKEQTKATLTGKNIDSVELLKTISAGGFTINADGRDVVVSGVDLSSVVSVADVVTALAIGVQGESPITFTESLGAIQISGKQFGGKVFAATSDVQGLAAALGFTEDEATIENGKTIETPAQALAACSDVNDTFYGVVLHRKFRDTQASIGVAEWVQARAKVFFNTTNDFRVLMMTETKDICSQLALKSMGRTLSSYSHKTEEYPSCSVAGRAFTVNFEGTNTTITLNLKAMPSITAVKLTSSQKAAMVKKNCNAFTIFGGVNVFSDSRMQDAGWFDTVHGCDWLQNRIQTDVFNLMRGTTTKIPYTDAGVGMVVQRVEMGLRQGVRNGLLAPGFDNEGNYHGHGYTITTVPVGEVSPSDKGNRIYKGITFKAIGAGALHNVQISGSFNE